MNHNGSEPDPDVDCCFSSKLFFANPLFDFRCAKQSTPLIYLLPALPVTAPCRSRSLPGHGKRTRAVHSCNVDRRGRVQAIENEYIIVFSETTCTHNLHNQLPESSEYTPVSEYAVHHAECGNERKGPPANISTEINRVGYFIGDVAPPCLLRAPNCLQPWPKKITQAEQ